MSTNKTDIINALCVAHNVAKYVKSKRHIIHLVYTNETLCVNIVFEHITKTIEVMTHGDWYDWSSLPVGSRPTKPKTTTRIGTTIKRIYYNATTIEYKDDTGMCSLGYNTCKHWLYNVDRENADETPVYIFDPEFKKFRRPQAPDRFIINVGESEDVIILKDVIIIDPKTHKVDKRIPLLNGWKMEVRYH